ncbi:hypothetical protein JCM19992_08310 [Thermostilla marina]
MSRRLTLRTLLAYLDEILEPEDAREIEKKIADSEVATRLVQRIHDVSRRIRLGAPDVLEHEEALDPNTVAEYLDYTLPADRVADFEKVCLESDLQLAEVAAVHQILAMVLGSPAEVSPITRDRVYRIIHEAEEEKDPIDEMFNGESETEPETESSVKAVSSPPALAMPKEVGIEPGTSHGSRFGRLVRMLVVLLLIGGIGVLAGWRLGWLPGEPQFVAAWFDRAEADRSGEPTGESASQVAESSVRQATPQADEGPSAIAENEEDTGAGSDSPVTVLPAPPKPSTEEIPDRPSASAAETVPDRTVAGAAEVPSEGGIAASETEVPPEAEEPSGADEEPGEMAPAAPAESVASNVGRVPLLELPAPLDVRDLSVTGEPIDTPPESSEDAAEPAPLPPEPIGKLLSPEAVVLRVDPIHQSVRRVFGDAEIRSYDVLLALPDYRPEFDFGDDIRMQVVGPAYFQAAPAEEGEGLRVSVGYGRFVMQAAAPAKVTLEWGNRHGILALDIPDTAVAVEVAAHLVPGVDPAEHPSPVEGRIVVLQGEAHWRSDDIAESLLTPVKELRADDTETTVAALETPVEWVSPTTNLATLLRERAALQLSEEFLADPARPVALALREAAYHRQQEVAWLAQRGLVLLGDVELVAAGLDDVDRKARWEDIVAELQAAAARSPRMAAAVRDACRRLFEEDGELVYRLLWIYPPDQLPVDSARELVGYLAHPRLAVRVLAIWNLERATGMRMYYEPDAPETRRKPSVERWRARVNNDPTLPGISRKAG